MALFHTKHLRNVSMADHTSADKFTGGLFHPRLSFNLSSRGVSSPICLHHLKSPDSNLIT